MKNRILTILFLALLTLPAAAQSAELGGVWQLSDGTTSIRVELSEQGNSWVGSSLSKTPATMKLNPAGLRNEWVGDLKLDETYNVKANLNSGKLEVTDLQSGKSWTMTREK